jgi:hypothetical protein
MMFGFRPESAFTSCLAAVARRRRGSITGLLVAAAAWLALPGTATAYVLNPVADTYITTHNGLLQPGVPDPTNGNHGSDSVMWLIPSVPTFALIRFDLSSFAGHDVLGDGVLTLPVVSLHPNRPAVPQTIAIHLALVAWDEGTVTWNNFGVASGPNFGVDIASASVAQITLDANAPPEAGSMLSFALPEATLQSWIDAPGTNRGFMVYSADNFNQLDITIRSREDTSGNPSQLTFATDGGPDPVDVPEPMVLAVFGTAILGLGWMRRHRRSGPATGR